MSPTTLTERETLPQKSQLRLLPTSSRYSRLLLSSSNTPGWESWHIPGEATGSISTPAHKAADLIPADFEPVPAPVSFKIPAGASVGEFLEAEIYTPGDPLLVREQKQEEFWEWEQKQELRERRWRERFGNPYTPLGQLQNALVSTARPHGGLPVWVRGSRVAQLMLFYPPVLERLVRFLDLQALLALMGTSVLLRELLMAYPPVWKCVSFDVKKREERSVEERSVEDAVVRGGCGSWTGSRARFEVGSLRLGGVGEFGMEARVLSSIPLVGLRVLNLDGSPAAGGRAFYDVVRMTRGTLEVLSVRFCNFVGVEDVEKVLVSCTAKVLEEGEGEDEDEDEDYDDDDDDDEEYGAQHCFTKDPTCALKKLRIWGIQGNSNQASTSLKTGLPVELSRTYIIRKASLHKVVDIDQRKSFINGMFYIPHNIPRKVSKFWSNNPASQDLTGRLLTITRQLGIETDFEDCDAEGDCWNHGYVSRTSSEWKVGVPGLRAVRGCSGCGRGEAVMCRDCEEHRTCFGCKRFFCRGCDEGFGFVGRKAGAGAGAGVGGNLYCEDCHGVWKETEGICV